MQLITRLCTCALLATLCVTSCGSERAATQLTVVVQSNLRVPAELSELRVEVLGTDGVSRAKHTIVLSEKASDDSFSLPTSFGVVPKSESGSDRVVVVVDGFGPKASPQPLVRREAEVGFLKGKNLRLTMFLSRGCLNDSWRQCRTGLTCTESGCETRDVDATKLPEIKPGDEFDGLGGFGGSAGTGGKAGAGGTSTSGGTGGAGSSGTGGAGSGGAGSGGAGSGGAGGTAGAGGSAGTGGAGSGGSAGAGGASGGGGCAGEAAIRIVEGADATTGRVEVCHTGVWGTICDDGIEPATTNAAHFATLVCTQLGYGSGSILGYGSVTDGVGTIWMDDVVCTGSETSLASCTFPGWGTHNCSHAEDVGVDCN